MEFDYGYADLKVTITLKADNESLFGQLSDNETLVLQQQLYLALNTFINVRALCAKEIIESLERIQQAVQRKDDNADGGKHNDEHCSI